MVILAYTFYNRADSIQKFLGFLRLLLRLKFAADFAAPRKGPSYFRSRWVAQLAFGIALVGLIIFNDTLLPGTSFRPHIRWMLLMQGMLIRFAGALSALMPLVVPSFLTLALCRARSA